MGQLLWSDDIGTYTEEQILETLKNFSQMIEEDPWEAPDFLLDNWPKDEEEKKPFIKTALDNLPLIVESDQEFAVELIGELLSEDLVQNPNILDVILSNLVNLAQKNKTYGEEVITGLFNKGLDSEPKVIAKIVDALSPIIEEDLEEGAALLKKIDISKVPEEILGALDSIYLSIFAKPTRFKNDQLETNFIGELVYHFANSDHRTKKFERGMLGEVFAVSIKSPESERHTFIVEDVKNEGIARVYAGCFSGTVTDFVKAVADTHSDRRTKDRKHYEGVIDLAKAYEAKLQKRAIK